MIVRRTGNYYYYICSSKVHKVNNECDCKNVRVDQLDKAVISQLKNYCNEILIKELPESIKNLSYKESDANNSESLKKELSSKNEMVSNLVKRIALAPDDSIAEMIMTQISSINEEIKSIESQLDNIHENKVKHIVEKENVLLFIESLKNFTKNIDNFHDIIKKRSLIQTVVKEIIWNDEQYEADITFLEDLNDECKKK